MCVCAPLSVTSAELPCNASPQKDRILWRETQTTHAHTYTIQTHMHTLPHYLNPEAECQRAGGM